MQVGSVLIATGIDLAHSGAVPLVAIVAGVMVTFWCGFRIASAAMAVVGAVVQALAAVGTALAITATALCVVAVAMLLTV
jgi:hypothetical protein